MRENVQADIDVFFDMVDVKCDGFIDKDELRIKMEEGFDPFPPGIADGMSIEQKIFCFFDIADTNRDGKISKSELSTYFQKMLDRCEELA